MYQVIITKAMILKNKLQRNEKYLLINHIYEIIMKNANHR